MPLIAHAVASPPTLAPSAVAEARRHLREGRVAIFAGSGVRNGRAPELLVLAGARLQGVAGGDDLEGPQRCRQEDRYGDLAE